MSLQFGAMLRIPFQPKKAFTRIEKNASFVDGVLMALILLVTCQALCIAIAAANAGSVVGGVSAVLSTGLWNMAFYVSVGMVLLFAVSGLSSALAGVMDGKKDFRKTVGVLGHGYVIVLLYSAITIAINTMFSAMLKAPYMYYSFGMAYALFMFVLFCLFAGWTMWVHGTGVSVANGVSRGKGIAAYFVSALIISVVIFLIFLFWLMSTASMPVYYM